MQVKYFSQTLCIVATSSKCDNVDPVIGILTQEPLPEIHKAYPKYNSYIAASYVKGVEGAGARAVPILIGQKVSYYRKLLSLVNGVLLPGGNASFNKRNGYADAARIIYKLAIEINKKNGNKFPIFGVCLGLQAFIRLSTKNNEILSKCNSENVGLPLTFIEEPKKSNLYKNADSKVISILSTLPVTSNHHLTCVTPSKVIKNRLNTEWRILTVNSDSLGMLFVSSLESTKYPFAAVQFHPEKSLYEWGQKQNNPHTEEAVVAARHFYDWFITEAKKNSHTFPTDQQRRNHLIENYPVFYTGLKNFYFDQVYLFT